MANIKVDDKTTNLIEYKYKNGNGRLKEMKYANGDKMKATYNQIGQMIGEKWYDLNPTLTAYYKYVYDNSGNIVRSIDMMSKKEYSYIYEDGVLVRSIEYKLEIDTNENITSRDLVNTIRYAYDAWGKCTILSDTSGCEIATVNPFRYRGYYYDAEIGMYYLQSR